MHDRWYVSAHIPHVIIKLSFYHSVSRIFRMGGNLGIYIYSIVLVVKTLKDTLKDCLKRKDEVIRIAITVLRLNVPGKIVI